MRIFAGWRAVGRAMQWARQQDGVTAPRAALEKSPWPTLAELSWAHADGRRIEISWHVGKPEIWVEVKRKPRLGHPANVACLIDIDNALTVLRFLAALDLIPAELAEVHDEWYGRCETCGGVLAWHSDRPGLLDGWSHVDQEAWVAQGPHRAAVAR